MRSVPNEYQQYIEQQGIFEGFTSGEPSYIELWLLADLPINNADIQIQDLAPDFVAFAGNGGGEILAFNATGQIFMLPLIGMEARYATLVAGSFAELVARFESVT
jgi:hypothetical protein